MKPPRVAIHFLSDGDTLLQSRLSLADQFSCEFQGGSKSIQNQLKLWIDSYLEKTPILPLFPKEGTPFQQEVWKALASIPFGIVLSYGELAEQIGRPKGARAIGNACGKNPFPLLIPCHRIIQANGTLGGFAFDLEIKKRLLEFEGRRG